MELSTYYIHVYAYISSKDTNLIFKSDKTLLNFPHKWSRQFFIWTWKWMINISWLKIIFLLPKIYEF